MEKECFFAEASFTLFAVFIKAFSSKFDIKTRPPHGWHTLDVECKGVFVQRGIKTVGREPSWCRPNSEYHKALAKIHENKHIFDSPGKTEL